jgi:cysteine desulfurase
MTRDPDIYLDNAATTRVCPEVCSVVVECMEKEYGNTASAHHLGISAERRVKAARVELLRAIGDPDGALGEIVWTSGGTESDALGVMGTARARSKRGHHIVYSAIEHSAVRESILRMCRGGWEASTIPVDASGVVSLDALTRLVGEETQLVALMLVNNEIGTIQPVAEAARRVREVRPDVHVHCDAVQALARSRSTSGSSAPTPSRSRPTRSTAPRAPGRSGSGAAPRSTPCGAAAATRTASAPAP